MFNFLKKIVFNFSLKAKPNKKPQVQFKRWSIVRGDKVMIRTGSDKGKIGIIMRVFRKSNTVIVYKVNMKFKHIMNQKGEKIRIKRAFPIHVSNVGLYDKLVKKPVRIRYVFNPQTNQKVRVSKKTNMVLPKPFLKFFKRARRGKNRKQGPLDTPVTKAHEITYQGQNFEAVKRQFEEFIKQKERKQKLLVFLQ